MTETVQGHGLIEDLSLSGVSIGEASALPEKGDSVELSFCIGDQRIPARADVVRCHDQGFAARFTRLDAKLQQMLMAAGPATALLNRPRRK